MNAPLFIFFSHACGGMGSETREWWQRVWMSVSVEWSPLHTCFRDVQTHAVFRKGSPLIFFFLHIHVKEPCWPIFLREERHVVSHRHTKIAQNYTPCNTMMKSLSLLWFTVGIIRCPCTSQHHFWLWKQLQIMTSTKFAYHLIILESVLIIDCLHWLNDSFGTWGQRMKVNMVYVTANKKPFFRVIFDSTNSVFNLTSGFLATKLSTLLRSSSEQLLVLYKSWSVGVLL